MSERPGPVMTDEEKRRRRMRSVALALSLGGLCLLFYLVTIAKLGPGLFNRPL